MSVSKIRRKLKLRQFHSHRAEFYEHLARSVRQKELLRTYIEEELAIARAPKTADSSKAAALQEMLRRIRAGEEVAFSRVIGQTMPIEDRMMLAAVDVSTDKARTLEDVAAAIRQQQEANKILLKALLVPLILVPGILVFAYVMAAVVIPTITKVAPPTIWTPYLSFVRGVSELIAGYGAYGMAALAAGVVAFLSALPRWTGPWRAKLDRVSPKMATGLFPVAPFLLPMALYRDFVAGQVLTTLAVLLNSGATLTDAMKTIARNSTPYARWHMQRMLGHLHQHATDYVPAFGKGLLSTRLLAMLASRLRNARKFDEVLVDIGTQGNAVIRGEVQRTAVVINAMLIMAGALFIIFLYSGQVLIADATAEAMDPMKKHSSKR